MNVGCVLCLLGVNLRWKTVETTSSDTSQYTYGLILQQYTYVRRMYLTKSNLSLSGTKSIDVVE